MSNTLGWPEHVTVPEALTVEFVTMDNPFMQQALLQAVKNRFEEMTVTSSIVVLHEDVVGRGINGNGFHQREKACLRVGAENIGKDYESCPGCHPDNHSERVAIRQAQQMGKDLSKAKLYMYGHWWSCEPCMNALVDANIRKIYLLKDSRPLFDRAVEGQKQNRAIFEELWSKKLTPSSP